MPRDKDSKKSKKQQNKNDFTREQTANETNISSQAAKKDK